MLPHSISIGDFNHIDIPKNTKDIFMHGHGLQRELRPLPSPPPYSSLSV